MLNHEGRIGGLCRYFVVFALILLTASPLVCGCTTHTAIAGGRIDGVNKGINRFALELYGRLVSAAPEENLFFSPYSVSTVFAMTYGGARGNTAAQIARTFCFPASGDDFHRTFSRLNETITTSGKSSPLRFYVANSLWPQEGYPLLKEYLELTEKYYRAKPTLLDYRGDPEEARRTINDWVAEKTEQKIKDLLKPGSLDGLTRLVLANAVYFKGEWEGRFDKERTADGPFFPLSGPAVQVPFMTQHRNLGYGEEDGFRIVELPYAGKELSMVIALPGNRDGLPLLEQRLTEEKFLEWVKRLQSREVIVYLPRFKVTAEFRLDGTLSAMGMPDAFSPERADFSGMDGNPRRLFIGMAVHKAYVDVNEEGTEAAAATAVGMRLSSMPVSPPVFRADHPFFFAIVHKKTETILFAGRIMNPRKGGK